MITILYPYRDRELRQIKVTLDSLERQSSNEFVVLFIDYGSTISHSVAVQNLLTKYSFVTYHYSYNIDQPWSRAKAINIGIKLTTTPFVFIADIDMIFREDLIEKLYHLKKEKLAIYFKVGYLNSKESLRNCSFSDYKISFESTENAQGLSLFSTEALLQIGGFDEFFHFWGGEDEDIHNRLRLNGNEIRFYNHEILMLHCWHPTYRNTESSILTEKLQLTSITRLNDFHLQQNKLHNLQVVNYNSWGKFFSAEAYAELEKFNERILILNHKSAVNHFLFIELAKPENKIVHVVFVIDEFQSSLKYRIKKLLGKTVPQYYSLKEINDFLLLHLISFYRNNYYSYSISEDLKSIELKIKK